MTDREQTNRARVGFWIALAVAGQGAAVALIDAGPIVRYQHYPALGDMLRVPRIWLVAGLACQAGLVFPAVLALVRTFRRELTGWFTPAGWALLAATVALVSATVSRDPVFYVVELIIASSVAFTQIATVVVAVAAAPDRRVRQLWGWWSDWGGKMGTAGAGPDRFVWICAALVVVACVGLSYAVYQFHPHVPDEVAYLMHGRYFAEGRLAMPLPPVPGAFSVDIMMFEPDRWLSPVPPGWPAVLSLGSRLGNPWLVNPVLAGCNIVLTHFVVCALYDRPTARLVTVFLAASPWHLFLGMSVMPHTLTLTCALAASAAVIRLRRTGQWRWAMVGGAAIGWVSMIRPLEALAVAGLLGVSTLVVRPFRRGLVLTSVLAVSTAAVSALQLVYNRAVTGDLGTFPIMAYTESRFGPWGVSNALGFGADRGLGWNGLDPLPGHGPIDVVVNTNLNLFALNIELIGWLGGTLALVGLGALGMRHYRADRFMVAVVASVIGIHAFYWFGGGPDFGPRYWYLVIVPCLVLMVRGVQFVGSKLGADGGGRAIFGAGILLVVSLTTFLPWRALDKYRGYRGMYPGVERLVPRLENGLVFVNKRRHPDYHSAVVYNEIVPSMSSPVFVRAPDQESADSLLQAFSGRPIWILDGPSVVDGQFQVRAGPLSPDEFRTWGRRLLLFERKGPRPPDDQS